MTRPALNVLPLVVALVLAGCSLALPTAPSAISNPPPVDTECTNGMAFVYAYQAIADRYDPQLESDRQQLAAAHSQAVARPLLANLAATLLSYDNELRGLHPPADFADGLSALLAADAQLRSAALSLAAGVFSSADETAFDKVASDRQAALHDLHLQVEFVRSECT